jgi:hypothetical protein
LCQLSIAGELTRALSITYTDNAVRHYWVSEAATWQSNKGSWVRHEESSIPARAGRAPIWLESVIIIQGVNHKTNVYIEKQCRVQCKSNVRIGKTWPYIGFLGPMYGFPIKPCLHGLIGRNANVRAMYGLAKHCHTLDFLDQCTDQCTDFQSSHVYMA